MASDSMRDREIRKLETFRDTKAELKRLRAQKAKFGGDGYDDRIQVAIHRIESMTSPQFRDSRWASIDNLNRIIAVLREERAETVGAAVEVLVSDERSFAAAQKKEHEARQRRGAEERRRRKAAETAERRRAEHAEREAARQRALENRYRKETADEAARNRKARADRKEARRTQLAEYFLLGAVNSLFRKK